MYKLQQGSRILFQGDSITHGGRGDPNNPSHSMGHGYAFNIASEIGCKYAEKQYQFMNRGISGNNLPLLLERWQKDTIDLKPDVLSFMSGINDIDVNNPNEDDAIRMAEQYYNDYCKLIEWTKTELPDCKIIVLEPSTYKLNRIFQLSRNALDVGEFIPHITQNELALAPSAIRKARIGRLQEYVRKVADKYDLIFVPMQDLFDKALERAEDCYWNWDSLHPTYSGHYMMSRRWLEVVQKEIEF